MKLHRRRGASGHGVGLRVLTVGNAVVGAALLPRVAGNGGALRIIALGHALVGAVLYRNELGSIAREGVVGAVPYRGPKATAFWFLMPSPAMWSLGRLTSSAEEAGDEKALRAAGRVGVATAAVGSACMPVSGFPLLFLVSLRSLWQVRERR